MILEECFMYNINRNLYRHLAVNIFLFWKVQIHQATMSFVLLQCVPGN